MSLTGAALAAVVCAGVALAADQSSLYIDPAPVTAVSVSSRAADATHPLRRADMLDPAELTPLSEKYGGQLVDLINSSHKSVWRFGRGGLCDDDTPYARSVTGSFASELSAKKGSST